MSYNDYKNRFFIDMKIDSEQQLIYNRIFSEIVKLESNRDIFNMSVDELMKKIGQAYKDYKIGTVKTYLVYVYQYISWACSYNLRNKNVQEYYDTLKRKRKEIIKYIQDYGSNNFIDRDMLYKKALNSNYINRSLIVLMVFEGFGGKYYSEINNLRFKDCNEGNLSIVLPERLLHVPKDFFTVLNKLKNSKANFSDNDYVISLTRSDEKLFSSSISIQTSSFFKTQNQKLNAPEIQDSGFCYYCACIEKILNKELGTEEYLKVKRRFNPKLKSESQVKDFRYIYNIYRQQKNIINIGSDGIDVICNDILNENIYDIKNIYIDRAKIYNNKINMSNDEDLKYMFAGKPEPPKPNTEIGRLGELIVLEYLTSIYGKMRVVDVSKERIGFDISLLKNNIYNCIEVKTTHNPPGIISINLTNYEIEKALYFKNNYWFYLVLLYDNNTMIYAVDNLFEALNITDYFQSLQSYSNSEFYIPNILVKSLDTTKLNDYKLNEKEVQDAYLRAKNIIKKDKSANV